MLMPKVKAASKHQREKAMSTLLLGFAADPIARFFFADSARWKITVTVHSIALIVRNRVHCHRIISMAVRLHPGGSRARSSTRVLQRARDDGERMAEPARPGTWIAWAGSWEY